ncbi:MgtC/SapB family protein [Streptomyces sp. TP-A0874]|uniref:MgtC/SapB family protein n=1 Tax=Streptomyces sp. TP-A0874 TaxID=549819 RepID=UPI000852A741|nr:MgtC/SapB family protein [Streptomyces sp. TP-A0874]
MEWAWGETAGQGWTQIGELGVALLLSAAIGLEREVRQKSAGLRTHTLVGVGSALIMLVSKYGFGDVLGPHVTLDPSRVAAQIVSGIGFIGGGLIFVRRDAVRGLTTAAVVWVTAAVGMAAGAGLPVLAVVVTAAHFLVVLGFVPLANRIPGSTRAPARLRVDYLSGRGVLGTVLATCTGMGFAILELSTDQYGEDRGSADRGAVVSVSLAVRGRQPVAPLAAALSELEGVHRVATTEDPLD